MPPPRGHVAHVHALARTPALAPQSPQGTGVHTRHSTRAALCRLFSTRLLRFGIWERLFSHQILTWSVGSGRGKIISARARVIVTLTLRVLDLFSFHRLRFTSGAPFYTLTPQILAPAGSGCCALNVPSSAKPQQAWRPRLRPARWARLPRWLSTPLRLPPPAWPNQTWLHHFC